MKKQPITLNLLILSFMLIVSGQAVAGFLDSIKQQVESVTGSVSGKDSPKSVGDTKLPYKDVVAGLKEALEKGAEYAIDNLGKKDGFLKNEAVKIPMPDYLQSVDKTLRSLGQDRYADEFVMTMNRAAEQAVPLTLDILKKGVSGMSIKQARKILNGGDNAATKYLRKVGGADMTKKISPIVSEATAKTGVTSQYKNLFNNLGFAKSYINPEDYDIDKYVTDQTVDGIFLMIAEEEKKIRENPVERTTDLLKKVFGS